MSNLVGLSKQKTIQGSGGFGRLLKLPKLNICFVPSGKFGSKQAGMQFFGYYFSGKKTQRLDEKTSMIPLGQINLGTRGRGGKKKNL